MNPSARALLLGLTLALVLLPSNAPPAALPLLGAEWSATGAELGWVVGAYLLGYAAAVLVVLPLTDRVSSARVIAGGALLSAFAFLGFPTLAHDVPTAIALRVMAGAGLAGVYMPGVRIVVDSAGQGRRGFAVGAYVSAFYLGSSLSFLAAGLLFAVMDWRASMLALGAVAVAGVPLAVLATRGTGAAAPGRAQLDLGVLRHAPLVRTITAYAGHSWELFIVRAWLAAFLAAVLGAQGLAAREASAVASQWSAIILALGIPGVFVGGWMSDHYGRAPTALAMAGASGVISFVFGALVGAPWALIVAVGVVYGGLIAADSAVYSVTVTEQAPPGAVGSAQAIQAFSGFGIGGLGPAAAGLALDLGLGWLGVFAVAGAVGLLSAGPLLLGSIPARRR